MIWKCLIKENYWEFPRYEEAATAEEALEKARINDPSKNWNYAIVEES